MKRNLSLIPVCWRGKLKPHPPKWNYFYLKLQMYLLQFMYGRFIFRYVPNFKRPTSISPISPFVLTCFRNPVAGAPLLVKGSVNLIKSFLDSSASNSGLVKRRIENFAHSHLLQNMHSNWIGRRWRGFYAFERWIIGGGIDFVISAFCGDFRH